MSIDPRRRILSDARRIVVKVGSSTLTHHGRIRSRKFGELAKAICALADSGREVVLVSSGAIAVGSHRLGWTHPGRSIREKQAAAAVGQVGLGEIYRNRFQRHGREIAQVLVTRTGLEDRERFLNARHTLLELLRLGVVPIVNENDTVATDEIRFGDNDNLSATIVNLIGAQVLIILTDVDGLYAAPPVRGRPRPPLIDIVDRITPGIRSAAQGSDSDYGRGGMTTKLQAAESAALTGAATVLCNGSRPEVLSHVVDGQPVGTLFLPGERLTSRKHWLAFTTRTRGALVIDEGAIKAVVKHGRSLLPAGIVAVKGEFGIGDAVKCVDATGAEHARGLVAYSSREVARILGQPTNQIAPVLGYSNGAEVIHRDDLVVLGD